VDDLCRRGMSAAFRVGAGYAALQGFWLVASGSVAELLVGRNCFANRARIVALLVVRFNLLGFWISFQQLGRKPGSLTPRLAARLLASLIPLACCRGY